MVKTVLLIVVLAFYVSVHINNSL